MPRRNILISLDQCCLKFPVFDLLSWQLLQRRLIFNDCLPSECLLPIGKYVIYRLSDKYLQIFHFWSIHLRLLCMPSK